MVAFSFFSKCVHKVGLKSLDLLERPPNMLTKAHVKLCGVISNSNWTEWSTIQGVIARIISKSDEREARGRFEITSTITP